MTGEENLEIVQRFLDKGELNAMAEDAVFQDFTQTEPIIGNKAISDSIFRHYNIQFHEADAEMINIVTGKTSEYCYRQNKCCHGIHFQGGTQGRTARYPSHRQGSRNSNVRDL